MKFALLGVLAACGRVGFDAAPGPDAVAVDTGDAGDMHEAGGPRWAVKVGAGGRHLPVGGTQGAVVTAYAFTGTTQVVDVTVTGVASQTSSVVVHLDATGKLGATTVLDAATSCDIRGLAMSGDTAIVAGLSAGAQMAALGPCSTAASRQNAVVIAVDAAGAPSLVSVGIASGSNAQAWNVGALSDGSLVASGIYSMGLAFGATSLPPAGADPNAFVVRLADLPAGTAWAHGLTGGVQITPGSIATDGDDTCMLGGYSGGGLTELGAMLPYLGASDELVARLDGAGAPRFVRGFGSTSVESNFNAGSIAAHGGGCVASLGAQGDVTLDGTALPASDGPAIVVWFDGAGALTAGYRLPDVAQLATVGARVIAAYTVSAPVTIGGAAYTPQGEDVIVVELDAQGPARLLGAVGGAGDQAVLSLAAIAPDAVAIGLTSGGALEFGTTSLATTDGDLVVAVLGI